jgi:hypothetical protein
MPLAEFIAVVASEETGTCSSAVHARRVAGVDRDTIWRSSAQVFVDGPGGGAPSDPQGRWCYDCDADHDSMCSRLSLSPNTTLLAQRCFSGIKAWRYGTAVARVSRSLSGVLAQNAQVKPVLKLGWRFGISLLLHLHMHPSIS